MRTVLLAVLCVCGLGAQTVNIASALQITGDATCTVQLSGPGIIQVGWDGRSVTIAWLPNGWCDGGSPYANTPKIVQTAGKPGGSPRTACVAMPLLFTFRTPGTCSAVPVRPMTLIREVTVE